MRIPRKETTVSQNHLTRPATIVSLVVAAVCLATSGCADNSGDQQRSSTGAPASQSQERPQAGSAEASVQVDASQSPSPPQEPSLGDLEIAWAGYTMAIQLVTDDPQESRFGEEEPQGKAVKVLFKYLDDPAGLGAFLKDDLPISNDSIKEPIILQGQDGTAYEPWVISNFSIFQEQQPEFSVVFDVPADSRVEDFQLVVASGDPIALVPFDGR
jgi:hypothetical protein